MRYYFTFNISWATTESTTSSDYEAQDAVDFIEWIDVSTSSDFSTDVKRILPTDTTISYSGETSGTYLDLYYRAGLKEGACLRTILMRIPTYYTSATVSSSTLKYYPTGKLRFSVSKLSSVEESPVSTSVLFSGAYVVYQLAFLYNGPSYGTMSYTYFCPKTQKDIPLKHGVSNYYEQVQDYTTMTQTVYNGYCGYRYGNIVRHIDGFRTVECSFDPSGGSVYPESITYDVTRGYLWFFGWPIPCKDRLDWDDKWWSGTGGTGTSISKTDYPSKIESGGYSILYAKFTDNSRSTAKVHFFTLGECFVKNKTLGAIGTRYGELPIPNWYGCSFLGWFTDSEGGTIVTEDTIVNTDVDHRLYAHWDVHDIQHGTWDYISPVCNNIQLFCQWKTEIENTADFNYTWEDTSSGSSVTKTTDNRFATITFDASTYITVGGVSYQGGFLRQRKVCTEGSKYVKNLSYIHSFSEFAYSASSVSNSEMNYNVYESYCLVRTVRQSNAPSQQELTGDNCNGVQVTYFPPNPEIRNAPSDIKVRFVGWSKTKDVKEDIISLGYQFTTTGTSYQLYAIWEEYSTTSIIITFQSDYGEVPQAITIQEGPGKVSIPKEHPYREGFIFAGWGDKLADATHKTGGVYPYAAEYFPGFEYTFSESKTLHAVWSEPIIENSGVTDIVEQGIEVFDSFITQPTISGSIPDDARVIHQCYPYVYCASCQNGYGFYDILDSEWVRCFIGVRNLEGGEEGGRKILTGTILGNEIAITQGAQRQMISSLVRQPSPQVAWGIAFTNITIGIDVDKLKEHGYEFYGWFTGNSTLVWKNGYVKVDGGALSSSRVITFRNKFNGFRPLSGSIVCPLIRDRHLNCYFDPQGGTVVPTNKDYPINGTFHDLPTPIYETIEFLGWYTEITGGTKVENGDSVAAISPTGEDIVLYARWGEVVDEIRVYFIANGGECSTEYKVVENGKPYGELPIPTKSGSTFIGWYTENFGGEEITSETIVSTTDNHYLYARWQNPSYTITLNPNGGTVSPTTMVVEAGRSYGAFPIPTKSGSSPDGWWTDAEGGVKVNESDKPASDGTLYAHWTESGGASWGYVKRSIVFETNGGTISDSYGEYKYYVGTPKQLPTSEQITKSGFVFGGWYDNPEFSGTAKTQTAKEDNTKLTFYAKWS